MENFDLKRDWCEGVKKQKGVKINKKVETLPSIGTFPHKSKIGF